MMPEPTRRSDDCLSDLRIDQLMAGELGDPEHARAQSHVACCERCATRLATLDAGRARFAAEAPVLTAARPWRRRRSAVVVAGALALAAAMTLLWLRGRDRLTPGQQLADRAHRSADTVRAKGTARLAIFAKRGVRVLALGPGDTVHPGDALRFAYTSAEPRFLLILGVDGAGQVTTYYPAGERAAAIDAGTEVALPRSFVLDATAGDERVYGLFCTDAVDVARTRAAVAAQPHAPIIPPSCSLDVSVLRKRSSP